MKANGRTTSAVAKASNATPTTMCMSENSSNPNLEGKESINGAMARSMMENGTMGSNMAMEFGKASTVTLTLASGRTLKPMVMEFIPGVMVIGMKESGKHV